MADFEPDSTQVPPQIIEKPTSVTVFGVLNIAVGCYQLIRILPGFFKIVSANKGWEMFTSSGVLFLLLCLVGIGLSVWLIVLGIGLLKMKRWARRGSILYGWIQVVFIVIALGAMIISLVFGQPAYPSIDINNGLALIHWIYMVLLLIFMKTTKVKQAFSAIGG